jgi:TDG/mug DNA glycosylase family protein
VGHHFARPGNRFWPTLHRVGFTPHQFEPSDERELLELGLGLTDIVSGATRAASELTSAELRRGGQRLLEKVQRFHPRFLALLGIGVYQKAFRRRNVVLGRQSESFGSTVVWVLPNPSGINAHYQPPDLRRQFRALRRALQRGQSVS